MVGTAASLTFDMSLPGSTQTALGGLTMVAVLPTHRRRGLLNAMMEAHFADCLERGEALSGLWASESSIYGRYGFGVAAPVLDVSISCRNLGIPEAPDEARIVDVDEARRVFPEVYRQTFAARAGRLSRSPEWWEHRHFRDPTEWRRGASERRYVVAYRNGTPVGYTTYRQKAKWDEAVSDGTISVGELFGIDATARLSLWSLMCSIDLFPNVVAENLPVDFELPWQVANPRMIRRRVLDGLYVRLLDVPKALEARGYAVTDSLVIGVADSMGFANGTFRLDASPEGAVCAASSDTADVTIDAAALAALYLGADGVGPLAATGRLAGDSGAIRRLGNLLRSDVAPCCPEIF